MKDFTTEQLAAQNKAGLNGLFIKNDETTFIHESNIIKAMKVANIDYFGAIDTDDQKELFNIYGIQFIPSRNNGENMWSAIRL